MVEYLVTWLQLKTDRRAVTAMEYGLIAALVAVAIIGAVSSIGRNLSAVFYNIASQIHN